jgi:hypothetical protein
MKARIEQLEHLALELRELGQHLPVIEKNCQIILSATYVLKFGISDIADMETTEGDII